MAKKLFYFLSLWWALNFNWNCGITDFAVLKCVLSTMYIFCDRLNVHCQHTVFFVTAQCIFLWQVDLGMEVNITGIATQGESYQKQFWTEKYTLNFSRDGVSFFADTPPLDGKNAAGDEHNRVIINDTCIKNCCTQRCNVINQWMIVMIVNCSCLAFVFMVCH